MSESFGAFFRSLFTARGRVNRGRFWLVVLVLWITVAVCGFTAAMFGDGAAAAVAGLLLLPVFVAAIVAGVFNSVKRLHDLGRSGWWLLLVLALYAPVALIAEGARLGDPDDRVFGAFLQLIANLVYLGVLGGIPGQRTPNRFDQPPGEDPAREAFGDAA